MKKLTNKKGITIHIGDTVQGVYGDTLTVKGFDIRKSSPIVHDDDNWIYADEIQEAKASAG